MFLIYFNEHQAGAGDGRRENHSRWLEKEGEREKSFRKDK
jgi:hypothetical protein